MTVNSLVHPDAKIEKNVKIGPFSLISENVIIGEGTEISSHVIIAPGARIGRFCKIFPGAVISSIPQDQKFQGEESLVIIGDYTTIREYVTINRGTVAGPNTIIGNHVLLMAYVHVAHDSVIGDHCVLANCVQLAGHVSLAHHVKIGGKAAIRQFAKIGEHAMISGGSLVRKDVPPFVTVAREPLRYCGLNLVGLQRNGFTKEQIHCINSIYDILFQQGLPMYQAIEEVEKQIPSSPEKEKVLDFITHTQLGLIKPNLKIQG